MLRCPLIACSSRAFSASLLPERERRRLLASDWGHGFEAQGAIVRFQSRPLDRIGRKIREAHAAVVKVGNLMRLSVLECWCPAGTRQPALKQVQASPVNHYHHLYIVTSDGERLSRCH